MAEEPRFVLGVDLDGVCFDYYRSIRTYAARWMRRPVDELTPNFTYGFNEWDIQAHGGYEPFHEFLLDQRYFEEMQPIPDATDALRRLSDERVRIRIITHRLFISGAHQEAVRQTVAWLDKHDLLTGTSAL
jgi:5' nucleotidase, deoxy (Pyrimidine), cytosolic type C protein (NT5C)